MALLCLCLFGCEQDQDPTQLENEQTFHGIFIPELMQRNGDLQQGKEWENVQRAYVKYRKDAKNGDKESLLSLAKLFINEARITGEHGHYYQAGLSLIKSLEEENSLDEDLKFRSLVTKAAIQLALHDFSDALETGEMALGINPYQAQVYGVLVDAYVEMGNYEQAVSMADQMVAIKPDLRSYARISYLRELHGDLPGAIEAMTLAVQASPPGFEESAWAMIQLGGLFEKTEDFEMAQKVYEQILAERPKYPFATAALANIAIEKGDFDQAEVLLNQAIESIPEVGFYIDLARIYQARNQNDLLAKTLRDIHQMFTEDEASGHNMNLERAFVYATLNKDFTKAIKYANQAYQKRPNNMDVNAMLAKIYALKGEPEKAKQHLIVATQTGRTYPELAKLL